MKPDFIKHLLAIKEKMNGDQRLNATHISLYMSLFFQWNRNWFQQPISISRSETMGFSKIGSPKTYTKCLKELDDWGYIKYKPSKNPLKGSVVYLFDFSHSYESVKNKKSSKRDHSNVQEVVLSINELNTKKEKHYKPLIPVFEEVESFFSEKGLDSVESSKFFKHYEGLGWMSGGSSIVKWKSFAEKWILGANGIQRKANIPLPDISSQQSIDEYYSLKK